jgi:hypothetical protein
MRAENLHDFRIVVVISLSQDVHQYDSIVAFAELPGVLLSI